MTTFIVPEMTCGHCTAAITKAIRQVDPGAEVACDLPTHKVTVETALDSEAVKDAIRSAGYESAPA